MATKKTQVRLLIDQPVDGVSYRANQVINLDAATAKTLVDGGQADDAKAAVEYALSLPDAVVIEHGGEAAAAEATGS